jgi:mannose-6-phosphate isomerase-like protein (cupin superfamily)
LDARRQEAYDRFVRSWIGVDMSIQDAAAAGIAGEYNLALIPCAAAVSLEFKQAARTFWHTHPGVQTLICVAGRGWVKYDDGTTFELTPGAMVSIPAGVKHWHGADAGADMTHVALNPPGEAVLMGPVSD